MKLEALHTKSEGGQVFHLTLMSAGGDDSAFLTRLLKALAFGDDIAIGDFVYRSGANETTELKREPISEGDYESWKTYKATMPFAMKPPETGK